jgi:beta-aspartyl-peptidase (threonine type)
MSGKIAVAVHGGAGTILKEMLTPTMELEYHEGLLKAINVAYEILEKGGTALDAVTDGLCQLEDNILFNAGKGSVFNHRGEHEMDASIMDGKTLEAGAVASVKHIKNPILLARAVMEHSEHVFLCADGAEEFAIENNMRFMPASYFFSDARYHQWIDIRDTRYTALESSKEKRLGTAGVVAVDKNGNVAAATSTGGMTNKRYMRIGDSPIIGAGTYANNKSCAISCTGHGEFFLRCVVAHDVSCLMEYGGKKLEEAVNIVVMEKLKSMGGDGGLIAVDTQGNASLVYNTEGMYRGWKQENAPAYTAIFAESKEWK